MYIYVYIYIYKYIYMYIYLSDLGDSIQSGNLDAVRVEWEGGGHEVTHEGPDLYCSFHGVRLDAV